MPGVLQVEAMAQVASIVMLRQPGNASKLGYFMSADKVKFRRVVVPGDTLIIEAELTKMRGNIDQATAGYRALPGQRAGGFGSRA